ncbi:glycosyltransferase family 10, partial [Flavobacteriaceae bacterium]|nr:glycosyltransferase family 10 [Flavobacteriaceae bacterium]
MIKIKLVKKGGTNYWKKQFPNEKTLIWGNYQFILDPNEKKYDWLIIIDRGELIEPITCSAKNTIFIATEPHSITYYGTNFVKQFAYLVTNQNSNSLPHANAIRTQPASHWFYEKPYSKIITEKPHKKIKTLSAIATNKTEAHTAHGKRFHFIKKLSEDLPQTDILFSRSDLSEIFHQFFPNSKFVPTKYDMLDDYKYHLAIGNQQGNDIFNERISDAFLGYCVPICWGCTNLSDYFPEDSFIEIDINNPEKSIEKIKQIINDQDDYNKRLKSVIEARRRIMEEYNLPAVITKIVSDHQPEKIKTKNKNKIYGRRIIRILNPYDLLGFIKFKIKNFLKTHYNSHFFLHKNQ